VAYSLSSVLKMDTNCCPSVLSICVLLATLITERWASVRLWFRFTDWRW